MKKQKKIPKFTSKKQEELFWHENDSTDFIDWNEAKLAKFPNLKPSTKSISLRLPQELLNDIKIFANKKDIPYQSLMKMFLIQGIKSAKR